MYKKLIAAVFVLTAFTVRAQVSDDVQNIKKLCGCFHIDFKYAETFSPDTSYKFHEREDLGALELALPIETSDKKFVIQHLLVIKDSMIIKHWREEWTFENPYLLKYKGDKKWEKIQLQPADYKGRWTQTVWEVDDAPRYQGISKWISNDNKTYWESTTDAPLPRREYSVRNDYNILRRGNRLVVTDTAYSHVQDNDKIISNGNAEKLLAQEKGINYYKRVDDSKCAAAKVYWEKIGSFWTIVRAQWDAYVSSTSSISLKDKADGKLLSYYFGDLQIAYAANKITTAELPSKVAEVLQKFL